MPFGIHQQEPYVIPKGRNHESADIIEAWSDCRTESEKQRSLISEALPPAGTQTHTVDRKPLSDKLGSANR